MSVLALASYIRRFGYEPEILDMRIQDYKKIDPDDYLAIGISSMSGGPLGRALELARYVREKSKTVPLIWGGVHVSFFPDSSIANKFVDMVVLSEGEETLVEILDRMNRKTSLENIAGTVILRDGKVIRNPDRPFLDVGTLDLPAYDLADVGNYSESVEYFSYESSRGCPHRCQFCYALDFHKRRWRAKSASKVIVDLKEIIESYRVRKVDFIEDNFFVDKKRVAEIANGIIRNKLGIKWMSFCRADYIAGFDDAFLRLLSESGCEVLAIGVESGSPTMLKKIDKDITPEQVIGAVNKCVAHGIMPQLSFIIGTPGETQNEMHETLDFCGQLYNMKKPLEINGIFVYAPYPGTPIYEKAVESGYRPFETLEGWATWKFTDTNNNPWLNSKYKNKLEIISIIARFRYFAHRVSFYSKEFRKKKLRTKVNLIMYELFVPVLKLDAILRWKLRWFSFAPEWKMYQKIVEKKFDKR
jgi:radical SAM superfamily enzyme YgiQ (UPF0313 family)